MSTPTQLEARPHEEVGPQRQPAAEPTGALGVYLVLPGLLALATGLAYLLVGRTAPPVAGAVGAAVVVAATIRRHSLARLDDEAVGVLAGLALALVGAGGILVWSDAHKDGVAASMIVVGGTVVAVAAIWAWHTAAAPSWRAAGDRLRAARRAVDRPGQSWRMYLVGAAGALPFLGTYSNVLSDSDSAWLAVSTREVREHGIRLLQENQEVLLPHLVYGPLIALDGYRAANLFALGSAALLLALAAVLAHRLTGRLVGSVFAVAGLLAMPEIVNRAERLPMYSLMFVLVYGSAWLLQRAMADEGAPRWLPIVAGIGFVLAYEAHSVGQLALAVPFLLLLLVPSPRRALAPLGIALGTIALVSIPRVLLNLSVGGLDGFRSNRTDYLTSKGYLTAINRDFLGQAAGANPLRYLLVIPSLARAAFGEAGLVLLLLFVVLAHRHASPRSRRFVIATVASFTFALAVTGPGTYGRYLTPLSLGLVLVAAVGLVVALDAERTARLLGVASVVALCTVGVIEVRQLVHGVAARNAAVSAGALPVLADMVDDGKAVLGVRPQELLWADPDVDTRFSRVMSEEDFVTYVTWPSDDEVIEVMERLGAGWILLHPVQELEIDYHETWIEPTYGKQVQHVERLVASDRFCHMASVDGYNLYRLGACGPGEPSGPFAPPPGTVPYEEPSTADSEPVDDPDATDDVVQPGTEPTTTTTLEATSAEDADAALDAAEHRRAPSR